MSIGLIIVIILILGSEFVNGWTDSPNAITTVVSTRVLKPRTAVTGFLDYRPVKVMR